MEKQHNSRKENDLLYRLNSAFIKRYSDDYFGFTVIAKDEERNIFCILTQSSINMDDIDIISKVCDDKYPLICAEYNRLEICVVDNNAIPF